MRRKRKQSADIKPDDLTWIYRSRLKMAASRLINDYPERPYWLSIPDSPGVDPVAGFYPCTSFKKHGRIYYGFLFREHRDTLFDRWDNARKHMTGELSFMQ